MAAVILFVYVYFLFCFSPNAAEIFDPCDGTGTWQFEDSKGLQKIYDCKHDKEKYEYKCQSYDDNYEFSITFFNNVDGLYTSIPLVQLKKDDRLYFKKSSESKYDFLPKSEKSVKTFFDAMKEAVSRCEKCPSKFCFASNHKIKGSNSYSIRRLQKINHVHLAYMNHLDVGYTTNQFYPHTNIIIPGFVNNVLNWYFQVYFPRAAKLGEELRRLKANETFIYTTHPWLVTLFLNCPPNLILSGIKLQCPSKQQLVDFNQAVKRGDISWHAGPLNQEAENSAGFLFDHGLTISENLDKQFGIKRSFRTLSQRDIPGMTQTVIPYLTKHNISAISVGVNLLTAPPAIPTINRWRYQNDEVITYWHKGGYPNNPGRDPQHPGGLSRKDCHIVDGLDHALCFAFRSDNYGPPANVQEIKRYFWILKSQFPGAEIKASTLEDFTQHLYKVKDKLPVVTSELGDTWIQGSISDPLKISIYRAIKSALKICFKDGKCSLKDSRVSNMTRFLTKLPEHTYGIASDNDITNWSNEKFYPLQYKQSGFINCTRSWIEHRRFNDLAIEALKDHQVVDKIRANIAELSPKIPNLTGYVRNLGVIDEGIGCLNGLRLRFNKHGSLVELYDITTNLYWASDITPLGQIIYNTYAWKDFKNMTKYYDYAGRGPGFYKINVSNADPESKAWFPVVINAYIRERSHDICTDGIYLELSFNNDKLQKKYGAPEKIWLKYETNPKKKKTVDIELQFFGKNPTRLPESLFFNFQPVLQPGHRWYLQKLGNLVDPANVAMNSSQYQHGIDEFVQFTDHSNKGLKISANETNIVSIVTKEMAPTPYPAPLFPIKQPIGVAFNILNNIWETNFIFWYPFLPQDKDFKTRFSVSIE